MLKKIIKTTLLIVGLSLFSACSNDDNKQGQIISNRSNSYSDTDNPQRTEDFKGFVAKGGDVSWITEMESKGFKFYYANGKEDDPISILKSLGMNTFRFRVWVNPKDEWNSLPDVLNKVRRAWKAGAHIMIDFHYSDWWADPSQQTIPAAWKDYTLDEMAEALAEHTRNVLAAIKKEGIKVDWVQVGNETSNGMLWPMGQANINPANYAKLHNAGYDAVKEVYPDAAVIIHLPNAQKLNDAEWLLGLLSENGGKWDIIGFSLYAEPDNYSKMVDAAKNTIITLTQKYQCPAMLCEVGMGDSYETQCFNFLKKCFALENEVPNGMYLGTLYWEPQCYNDFNGYKMGAFTKQGRPGKGLDAYGGGSSVPVITAD